MNVIFTYLMKFLVSLVWNYTEAINQNSENETLIVLVHATTGKVKANLSEHYAMKADGGMDV
jgi:hypothetical protein